MDVILLTRNYSALISDNTRVLKAILQRTVDTVHNKCPQWKVAAMSSDLKLVTSGTEAEPAEGLLNRSAGLITSRPTPRASDRRNPERTVLGRIASIMEAFDGSQQVLGLGDLSERTGLPKSTLHRLADQLCQVRWMTRDAGGYRLGMRMFELGNLAIEENTLHEAALPHLQALAVKTGMSAHLGILDGAEVIHLDKVTTEPTRLAARRGSRLPAYCTALGKAIAAFDDDAMRTILSSAMPRRTANTITEPFTLRAELSKIRATGVAFDRSEMNDDIVCVAAPIGQPGDTLGAVSLTGVAGRMRWNLATDAVLTTASIISNATYRHRKVGVRL
ncbi:IclR family transcriptional regulator [Rhodococcus sp. CX]|uniref:IclR family transcriptional regulator n=1 Tax=Rhodococcus sp. CX TaxID=2789880 RepID=UPI0018CF7AA1|nr:IclR family transcriptional regulator [Rhodococcus sp. CX]MBH0121620.1 IclR family transcriptional regulator [Rhodococcus sp. CX]